jgi:methionyl-tRNA formyltransferase
MTTVVALVDCRLGLEVARYLDGRGELVGLVLHPSARRNYIAERDVKDLSCWVEAWPNGLDAVRESQPDYLLSVQFGYRVPKDWLAVPTCLPLNVHPGYLPDNKGRAPTAWPILDGSRAGVTLHVMTEEFDAGPWLAREEVPVYPEDTGDTLAERVEATALSLIKHSWPRIDELDAHPQEPDGAYHSFTDIMGVTLSDADLEVVDKLRARVYHGNGMRFQRGDHTYEMRVDIKRVES